MTTVYVVTNGGPGTRCPRPRWCVGNWPGCREWRWSACPTRVWRNCSGTRSPRSGPTWREYLGSDFRFCEHEMETNGRGNSSTARARPAPAPTPCWKTSFPGHRQHRQSSRAENPTNWWSSYAGAPPIAYLTPAPTRSPVPPPKSCCWSCHGASSDPAAYATTPGATGTALTRTATGPRRASCASYLVSFETVESREPESHLVQRLAASPTVAVFGWLRSLEVGGLPVPVECGCLGSVDAEVHEPALTRQGRDPLSFFAFGRCWAEEEFRSASRGILQFDSERNAALLCLVCIWDRVSMS